MMTVNVELAVFEDGIARDYKNDVIDTGLAYPLDEYVEEALYEDLYNANIKIPEEEIRIVIEKVEKELDKLLKN